MQYIILKRNSLISLTCPCLSQASFVCFGFGDTLSFFVQLRIDNRYYQVLCPTLGVIPGTSRPYVFSHGWWTRIHRLYITYMQAKDLGPPGSLDRPYHTIGTTMIPGYHTAHLPGRACCTRYLDQVPSTSRTFS